MIDNLPAHLSHLLIYNLIKTYNVIYAFAAVKTEEITFRNTFCPDKHLCFLAGKSHPTLLQHWLRDTGYSITICTICHYLRLFVTIRTIWDYSHYSLFGTIRCSLFTTIRYSLFGFSRHTSSIALSFSPALHKSAHFFSLLDECHRDRDTCIEWRGLLSPKHAVLLPHPTAHLPCILQRFWITLSHVCIYSS